MDAFEALLGRVSSGTLTEPGPTDAQLDQILSAAVTAPDHGRMRPWRFVLARGAARERLGVLFAEAASRRDPSAGEAQLRAVHGKALLAPLIIIVAAAVCEHPKVPAIEQILAAGAAAQNILLAAHALGLGGMWRTGAFAYDTELKRALGFAAEDALVGFLYIGTPAKSPLQRQFHDSSALIREL